MKLVILTKPTFFVEEDKILTALFEEGMDNLHLCKPGCSPVFAERLLSLLSPSCRSKITVHEHYYLRNEFSLYGIHVDEAANGIPKGYKGRIGVTCDDVQTLRSARKSCNYIFFGKRPLSDRDSLSDIIDSPQLKTALDTGLIDKRVYAYWGGLNLDIIPLVKDMGFGGIVIGSDLWNKFNIHSQIDYRELICYFRKLRNAVE